jgi:glycogen debranching enzyme
MKISYFSTVQKKIEKEVDTASFLLSNKLGDYLWMSDNVKSRYEGWFCRLDEKMYRFIETIEIEDGGDVLAIENFFNHIERKRSNVEEIFYLSESSHSFVYELSESKNIRIFFDVRESYSSLPGKDYKVTKEKDFFIIKFDPHLYFAIKAEEGNDIQEKIQRHYLYDESRNSPPFTRDVYKGLLLSGKRFVFAVANNKRDVQRELKKIHLKNNSKEKKDIDFLSTRNALDSLLVLNEKGSYAGLPWFFHFWQRDEAISLKSIIDIDKNIGKEIFFRLLKNGLRKGPGGVRNIDTIGWLTKRVEDVLPLVNVAEKEKIKREIKKYLEEFLWAFTEEGLFINQPYETWMDSLKRDGARIELQAMKLNMYKTLRELSRKKSEKDFYKKLELEMKNKVKKIFFDGFNLYDGYYPREKRLEKIIRPNIFIAAYIYPELLSKKEWIKCFSNALEKLWLPWGGISTLDKNDENFCNWHTGENSRSYHQGDSWFYLNNIAALVLYRLDKKKFKKFIKKVLEASREEILFMGAIGCHGEVSSALELRSEGCSNQAWSNALYLEAKKEIKF